MKSRQVQGMCYAAAVAALYVVFTYLTNLFGLANGVIQVRVSEALCVLAVFTPYAVPGLWLGCALSNFITGCEMLDVVFGSLATLVGAGGGWLLRRYPLLVPLPTVLANMVVVPLLLRYVYLLENGYWFMVGTVGAGEVLSAWVLGVLLYMALRPHAVFWRLHPSSARVQRRLLWWRKGQQELQT